MDFDIKNKKFKDNYKEIKTIIKKAVKKENLTSGSGGSQNIIILHDQFVIKIIPSFKNKLLRKKPNNDYLEAEYYKKLTDEFIKKNKTPHFVGIYKRYLLEDIKIIFPDKCLTFDEKIFTPWDKINEHTDKLCLLKKGYQKNLVEKKHLF